MKIQINGNSYEVLEFEQIKNKCFGFIYVTINNLTGKKYLGLHTTWRRDYIGSGNYLKAAIKKYGKENFTRYIIDTADSYEELCYLESHYITEAFGENIAESKDWYNITSGLQRGGNTWAGMSEEDRSKRAERLSKALKGRKHSEDQVEQNRRIQLERMKDPENRKKISEATKRGMANPEVRKRLSEAKKGKSPSYSPEQLATRRERMREVGKLKTKAWNKGKQWSDEHRSKLSSNRRGHFKVTLNDQVICSDLNAEGGYQGAANALSELLGVKIGKNLFSKLVNTGEPYKGVKETIVGLRIERVS
ncbi:homing endonuclease [Bacillus phage Bobb]|uniref:Homing endonuclease n=1 Tax=Bacillus phage Bobb TaxID=1527469 RepID=A0A076GDG0_9CAUD|nr:homing endonuclease [Bacillus phage Bobb]AII28050.1 homing endonuclease [Bacillus phage Bobb]